MNEFNFERTRADKITREEMLTELENVAKAFNFVEFRRKDYDQQAKISSTLSLMNSVNGV